MDKKPYSKPCYCGHGKSHHDKDGLCCIVDNDKFGNRTGCDCVKYTWDKEKS